MNKKEYKYIYGPVTSWRLGISLGIDPLSQKNKICNFDCIYCQLGRTSVLNDERKEYVPTQEIVNEINSLPAMNIDYLTFSGKGEPTLARNLGDMIEALREVRREKIAVITNSTLMYREDVQQDLFLADFVLAKLDACSEETFVNVNRAMKEVKFKSIIEGISFFKSRYRGKLALQIMFLEHNKNYASEIAKIAREINPDEIELNTPVRPSGVKPLSKKELNELKKYFEELPVITAYDQEPQMSEPLNDKDTIDRHGDFRS